MLRMNTMRTVGTFVLALSLLFGVFGCGEHSELPTSAYFWYFEEDHEWKPISDCVMNVNLQFSTGWTVKHRKHAELVFRAFLEHKRSKGEEPYPEGTAWRFERVEPNGTYLGVKYWKVTASYVYEGIRYPQDLFDVSEHGEVVILMGCI